ncbi:DUF308 domain-containing protein [Candidatus Saccharibacteria bacterium]|nr:DUF308 domain-containing protein [Candidatus Saccharibacteria bacterium]
MSKVEIIKRPVEQIGMNLKKSAWAAVIESLVIAIFGILLIAWPDITVVVVANILGTILIVGGIYQVINYFVVKGQNDFFNNSLLAGVVSVLVGIAAIVIGEDIANVFRIIIGIWMIYESLVRVDTSIKLHAAGVKVWSYILIIALAMLALGIFVTFNTGAVVQLIGWMMVLTGIIGIVGDIMFIQQVNTITDRLTKE